MQRSGSSIKTNLIKIIKGLLRGRKRRGQLYIYGLQLNSSGHAERIEMVKHSAIVICIYTGCRAVSRYFHEDDKFIVTGTNEHARLNPTYTVVLLGRPPASLSFFFSLFLFFNCSMRWSAETFHGWIFMLAHDDKLRWYILDGFRKEGPLIPSSVTRFAVDLNRVESRKFC